MIFNPDFDRTLWLILVGDKKNRYDIAKLVNSVPIDLLEEVNNYLKKKDTVDLKTKKFNKVVRDSLGTMSLFTIEVNDKYMTIRLTSYGQSVYNLEEKYELELKAISYDEIVKLDTANLTYVGYYSWFNRCYFLFLEIYKNIIKGNRVGYDLFDAVGKEIGIQVTKIELSERSCYKFVNLDKIPDEINMDDLDSKRSVNRLVRFRRRGLN